MSIRWSEAPALKGKVHFLSPECRDLLDKIFVLDPTKRINIPEIMKHQFFTNFLSPQNQVRSGFCPEALPPPSMDLPTTRSVRKLDLGAVCSASIISWASPLCRVACRKRGKPWKLSSVSSMSGAPLSPSIPKRLATLPAFVWRLGYSNYCSELWTRLLDF